jgi:hypothetical protein
MTHCWDCCQEGGIISPELVGVCARAVKLYYKRTKLITVAYGLDLTWILRTNNLLICFLKGL